MEHATPVIPLLDRPYSERRLILVTDDQLAKATERHAQSARSEESPGIDWKGVAEAVILDLAPLPLRTLNAVAKETIRSWGRAWADGVSAPLPIGRTDAKQIDFPPGHPRERVIYVGHPAKPSWYITMADFHRVVFEHKFCEAIELLMSLGATSISVEHISGWSRGFSAKISVPLGDLVQPLKGKARVKGKARAKREPSRSNSILFEATLAGVEPALPGGLVWYNHEPTWQSIAKGRLDFGLSDFSMSVLYQDDFGINAGIKIALAKTGLDLGGKFEDHQSTEWLIKGKFGPYTPATQLPDASCRTVEVARDQQKVT